MTAGVPAPATATVLRWVSKLPENSHGDCTWFMPCRPSVGRYGLSAVGQPTGACVSSGPGATVRGLRPVSLRWADMACRPPGSRQVPSKLSEKAQLDLVACRSDQASAPKVYASAQQLKNIYTLERKEKTQNNVSLTVLHTLLRSCWQRSIGKS